MDKKQTVASISSFLFDSLSKEVRSNGKGAILNRTNIAVRFREQGRLEDAEHAERDAEIMVEIAKRQGLKI